MKIKKLIALIVSIVLCLLIYTPAYAVIPADSIEHTVTILSGEGRILKNKDTTYNGEGVERYISLSSLDDLEEVEQVEYSVVDGENLKDMLDYSNCDGSVYTASFDDNLIAKLIDIPSDLRPKWRETAFITSTRVVNHYLSLIEASGLTLTSGYTDIAQYLPTGIKQLLFFVPPNEEYSFSYFVDQYGNVVTVSSSITKDLILTPVYTTEYVEDILDKTEEKFHQVRFLSGEGRIEYVKLSYDWDNSVSICDGYTEIDYFDDIVIDGQNYRYGKSNYTYYDVIQSYAIFQGHDFPVAFNLLKSKEADVVAYLNEQNLYGAILELDDAITTASKFMFSSPYYYQENVRPYSISLLAFLSNFTVNNQKLSDVLINLLADLQDAFPNWNNYSDEEKEEFIAECLDSIAVFENKADWFVDNYYAYMAPSDKKTYRISADKGNFDVGWGFVDINSVYYESDEIDRSLLYDPFAPVNKVVFIPPSRNYEFDHFEDQYGKTFDPATPVTEDLVLTPIYRELHEYHLTFTKGEGEMRLYYRAYIEELHHSESTSDPIDEVSIKYWRGTYSYEIERQDGLDKRSSKSSYTDMGLHLQGLTFEESLYGKANWNQINVYGDDDYLLFIPPDNCVFDHFEDENGDVWEYGTELTKDTVVTPIYRSTAVDTTIRVVTEDNSNEDFDITLLRSFKNTIEEVYDKGDYDGTVYEYLNDKNSYHFDENDWEITNDGMITNYTGELIQMLGIPDSVNGITVKGVATDTFSSMYQRYLESYDGPYQSEAPYDYYNSVMAIWIPKTIARFSEGISNEKSINEYKAAVFDNLREQLVSQGKTEEEQNTILKYYEDVISLTLESSGTNNCTPLVFLPLTYVAVEEGNKNYISRGGSLYDKDYSTLLSLSVAARLDTVSYYNNYEYEVKGLELPKKVKKISAFATFNAVYSAYGNYFPIYSYGNTNFDNYFAYLVMNITLPDENFINELCLEKFGMSYIEMGQMADYYENPPDEVYESLDVFLERALTDAQAAGLLDEEYNFIVSDEDATEFVFPYFQEWLNSNPNYSFTSIALELSMYFEGIKSISTEEYLISESEIMAWQKEYIETHSNGAFTLDQNGYLTPNLTEEEREEIEAKLQIVADQNILNMEDTREQLMIAYSICSFVMITNPENVEAAKGPFIELLRAMEPDISQSEINENLEFFEIIVQSNTSFEGQINKYGKVSQSAPFVTSLNFYDSYTYAAYLTDVPERYIPPNIVEIKPAENVFSGTIYLRLKRGNIEIETVDSDDSTKHLEASYTVYDSGGDEVATLTTTDGIITGYKNLTYGTYTIVQTSVESGYMVNTDRKTASITENGDVIRVVFDNRTTSNMYSVRIPKAVVLDGASGQADCAISVMGSIENDRKIVVTPIEYSFPLYEQSANTDRKGPITVAVCCSKTEWIAEELSSDIWSTAVWRFSANLTAGMWKGCFAVQISIEET